MLHAVSRLNRWVRNEFFHGQSADRPAPTPSHQIPDLPNFSARRSRRLIPNRESEGSPLIARDIAMNPADQGSETSVPIRLNERELELELELELEVGGGC